MSETPQSYSTGDPVPPTIPDRVEELEQQYYAIMTALTQHTNSIAALVNLMDRFRFSVDSRLTQINQQLAEVQQSNRVIIDLINTRLPPPDSKE